MDIHKEFGCRVFSDAVMRQRLPKGVYQSLQKTRTEGTKLDFSIAEAVATAMKDWAVEQGATHYVHWFQPLNGAAVGKAESFISPVGDGTALTEFSPKALVQGEPDASSFPSGGLRNTFEARGYTAWDPTSHAFVKDGVLYIPTAFCGFNGESLDQKTPLLRSMDALSAQAVRLLHALGETHVKKVTAKVGAEQEYFLIDRARYEQRLDLKLCGHTLVGALPPKTQQLDDHYYGRVRLRVSEFMRTVDEELWKYGIASHTRHNEVAPTQHEVACIYDTVNVTCDQNQLVMEVLREVAKKQGLACLLHEKPFSGVNGSGKHNNFSLATDTGENLFQPDSANPARNARFCLFAAAFMQAVDEYGDLLRLATATPNNDLRLGGFEAPPAIISMYLGDHISAMLEEYSHGGCHAQGKKSFIAMGVSSMPDVLKDDADRNRTSPLAFTGNKFEFRMVGSSQSIALANTVLCTMLADVLGRFADRLQEAGDQDAAMRALVSEALAAHGRIVFNGNNYSEEWQDEARRRGLPNLGDTLEAAPAWIDPKNTALFARHHVFSAAECHARYEVLLESYLKTHLIEAGTLLEMLRRQIIPAVAGHAGQLAGDLGAMRAVGVDNAPLAAQLQQISADLAQLIEGCNQLDTHLHDRPEGGDLVDEAEYLRQVVLADMQALRTACDRVEVLVGSSSWPIPSYTDLMHRV